MPADLLKVKQVVAADDQSKQLVVVERNGIEYVLRPGGKLVDQTGQPIPNWTGWTVGFVSENTVVFTDGLRDMSARAP